MVALALLLAAGVFLRTPLLSGFDAASGNLGDGRFNLAVLEHWYQVALGGESWRSPVWFHPVVGVLGMSDALALIAPPYVLARFAGATPVAALGLTQAALLALGMAGMLLFLRRLLGLAWPAVLAGTVAFAAASGLAFSIAIGHLQLITVELLPWFAAAVLLTLRRPEACWPVAAALLLAGMLTTSFYVGWFAGLEMLLLAALAAPLSASALPGWLRRRRLGLGLALAAFALALVPFALLYGPVVNQAPPRPWEMVALTLPDLSHLFEARANALWGPVGEALAPGLALGGGELGKGLSWGLTALFLATFVRLALAPVAGLDPLTRRLALVLGASVLAGWALMLKIGGTSLWWLIYHGVPGGGTIRSVFRFNLVLAFPVAVVAALGLDLLWRHGAVRPRGRWAVAALAALVMVEQLNLAPGMISRSRDFADFEKLPPAPADCRAFVLLPAHPDPFLHKWSHQTGALVLAEERGLPTLNGYSGMEPRGWALYDPTNHDGYRRALVAWADAHGLWPGLCGVDPDQRRWFPLTRDDMVVNSPPSPSVAQ